MFNYCLPTTKVSIRKPSITVVDQISKNTSNQIYQNKTDKITMHYSLQWGQTLSCGAFLITKYRGFLPYATFGTWKKTALAKNRISKIFILCTQ